MNSVMTATHATWLITTMGLCSSAVPPNSLEDTAVTITPWSGELFIPGAFLLARVNLHFINATCNNFATDLTVAQKVAKILIDSDLRGATSHQIKQFSYSMLLLESELKHILEYVTDLLLCPGWGGPLWSKFYAFRNEADNVWKLLTSHQASLRINHVNRRPGLPSNQPAASEVKDPHIVAEQLIPSANSSLISLLNQSRPNSLVSLLNQVRPQIDRQPRGPALVGLGLGFLGSLLFTNSFDTNNERDIDIINNNILKQNKMIRMTNERIDILAKNVSTSFALVRTILDQLVETQNLKEIHFTILWNLDQLIASSKDIKNTFRSGEFTVTLLEQGTLVPDLIELDSVKRILNEGHKSFPTLHFPLEPTRQNVEHMVKILKVERVAHLKFIMHIPLTYRNNYKIYGMVAHPIQLSPTSLVLPRIRNIFVMNHESYLVTDKSNVYSILTTKHLLLQPEPVIQQSKMTCEYASFQKNVSAMLNLCNYEKAGSVTDTFVTETEKYRLVFFNTPTRVSLNCPESVVKDKLQGLHKLPLACDVTTEEVHWPAKQILQIDSFNPNQSVEIDTSLLPIINITEHSKVHETLRELISEIPSEDPFTIDFKNIGLTPNDVASYSVFTQAILTVFVVLNSLLIGFLCLRSRRHKEISGTRLTRKFKGLRDSLRGSGSLRRFRKNINNKKHQIRESIRLKAHGLKRFGSIRNNPHIAEAATNTEPLEHISPIVNVPPSVHESYPVELKSTTHDLYSPLANKATVPHELYPPLPRY